jgi:DNA-binding transcriptional regulator YhcF (GntR family)
LSAIKFEITEPAGQTKIQHLVHTITEAISNGLLKKGEVLPSVNQMSEKTGYSRDTIFKAYNILKERNVIESFPQKGYFVARESFRIFMLLDDFSAFKEQLYKSFRKNLSKAYSVDLLFHHYNREIFDQLIMNSLGRYSIYITMNIDNGDIAPVLKKIDPNKLLILDMGKPSDSNFNFLTQDFSGAVKNCLQEGLDRLKKYDKLIMVYNKAETPHPVETTIAVREFCIKNKIKFRLVKNVSGYQVDRGQAWFVIRDADLVEVIKSCRKKNLRPGTDIGILSYNDTPMKQIAEGGISVISADFELMGKLAAGFVKNKQKIATTLSTSLILRESF